MLRFTIREVLVLTLSAGLAVGWWLDRQQLAADADNWRKIAGGLEHIMQTDGSYKVGLDNGRVWAIRGWTHPHRMREVGMSEFEPKLGTKKQDQRPVEPYYSNWPRKTP